MKSIQPLPIILIFLVLTVTTGLAQTVPPPTPEPIGPSDTLTIAVLGSDELSKDWRVDDAGRVNLPFVGTLSAAGKSAEILQGELTVLLRKYFVDPQVTVYVSESRSRPVTITGAVERPGVYQLRDLRTLSEVLVLASGPKDAGPTVTVTRLASSGVLEYPGIQVDGDSQVVELPLADVISGHGEAAKLRIQSGDVISVTPVKNPKLVQVSGEVNRPGSIELTSHDKIPLIQALGMAGGMTRTAAPKRTLLVHVDSEGRTRSEQIDVRKVMSGEIQGVMLNPGDVLVVPANNVTAFIQAASLSAVTTGVYVLGRF
jgi:polysaccharide export outer membrane protein